MDLKCHLETRTSKEGNKYTCAVIYLDEDYQKLVFLNKAELSLVEKASMKDLQKGTDPFAND